MTSEELREELNKQRERKTVENNFTYYPPKPGQAERYQTIREIAKGLAMFLEDSCPESRERSLAMTKLEECVMWANASIARNELCVWPVPTASTGRGSISTRHIATARGVVQRWTEWKIGNKKSPQKSS